MTVLFTFPGCEINSVNTFIAEVWVHCVMYQNYKPPQLCRAFTLLTSPMWNTSLATTLNSSCCSKQVRSRLIMHPIYIYEPILHIEIKYECCKDLNRISSHITPRSSRELWLLSSKQIYFKRVWPLSRVLGFQHTSASSAPLAPLEGFKMLSRSYLAFASRLMEWYRRTGMLPSPLQFMGK